MESEPGLFYWLVAYLSFIVGMYNFLELTNWYLCILGWELMGVCSFYLIGTFSSRAQAISSSSLALCINRVGDICLFLAMLNGLWPLLLLSVLTKSSMLMFSGWLPSAMEGPTPVSALLHSSTMVVAGVFLLIRLSRVLGTKTLFCGFCFLLGGITSLFASTVALFQYDFKKVVAYSTTRQLGLMVRRIGLGQPLLSYFRICTHAFFKAMLF